MTYFNFQFDKAQAEQLLQVLKTAKDDKQFETDPQLIWDAKRRALRVDYHPGDFAGCARGIRNVVFYLLNVTADSAVEKYGTDAAKAAVDPKNVEAARDYFRNAQTDGKYPPAPIDPGLDPSMSGDAAVKKMTGKNPAGFCLGGGHGPGPRNDAAIASMESGVDLLFVEEFSDAIQPDIDDFLSGQGKEMSERLRKLAEAQGMVDLLKKAQAKGAKVVGISPGTSTRNITGAQGLEERAAKMNMDAEKIIKATLAKNKGSKFMALLGEAHCNTHPGGIPGLAQLLRVPAVAVDDHGTYANLPEDPSLRPMPTKEQQTVIDAVLGAAGGVSAVGEEHMEGEAVKLREAITKVRALTTAGKLSNAQDATKLITPPKPPQDAKPPITPAVPPEIARIVSEMTAESTVNGRKDRFLELLKAKDYGGAGRWLAKYPKVIVTAVPALIKANEGPSLDWLLVKDPGIAKMAWAMDKPAAAPGEKTLLHIACKKSLSRAAASLIRAGADVNVADADGNTPLHFATIDRADHITKDDEDRTGVPVKQIRDDQAEIMDLLLSSPGRVDPNAKNKAGKTPMHLAAWNNHVEGLATLKSYNADPRLTDNRGWNPLKMATGSTKVEAEKFFYDEYPALATTMPAAPPGKGPLSTIDLLCRATTCEDGQNDAKMRKHYEELYSNETLRPILDLAAASSAGTRVPPERAMRIFVSNGDNPQMLYNAQKATTGGFDEKANVLVLAIDAAKDLQGTIVHELTHAAACMLHGDETIPAAPGKDRKDYLEAIQKDARLVTLAPKGDADLIETVSGRMGGYVTDASKEVIASGSNADNEKARNKEIQEKADLSLMREFLVGIPQIIAQHGDKTAEGIAPNLTTFFKRFSDECRQALTTDDRYRAVGNRLDNSKAKGPPPIRKPRAPLFLATANDGEGSAAGILEKVKALETVEKGTSTISGGLATVHYSHTNYKLSDPNAAALEKRSATIEKALAKALAEGALPPELPASLLKSLVEDLTHNATGSAKEIEAYVQRKAGAYARESKLAYVEYRLAQGKELSDTELAESIILRAENAAFAANPPSDGDVALAVDAGKHKTMVADLAKKLASVNAKSKADRANLQKIADAISNGPDMAFYRKKKEIQKGSGHVSIDTKAARKAWTIALAKL